MSLSLGILKTRSFATSSVAMSRLKVRRLLKETPEKVAKFDHGRAWRIPPNQPKAPLTATEHPTNRFAAEEEKLTESIAKASEPDLPDETIEDPYKKEEARCILCPKRYSIEIRPSWKNPKLLSQFISPHTGFVYSSNITGLCEFMQKEVELEVARAKAMGMMPTNMKDLPYLKDPPLFNPTKPMKPNPY